jgi:predicted NBD/HSP70 family sugar kinase
MDEQHAPGVAVGVDIGGTKTALMATDVDSGQDLATETFSTETESGPEAMIERIAEAATSLVAKAGRPTESLAAVGLAVPGLVGARHGRVISAGNLKGWLDIPLRDILSRRLGVPVAVEQDANAAALGEKWRGGAKEMNNFVFLALGTGIGAGVMINGRLHRGFRYAAGEIGNLVLNRNLLGQERGGHGSLELLVGGRSIRGRASEATGDGASAAEALARAPDDERLAPIADEVVDYVAMATIAIATLIDPEAIIFGGGTADAGEDLLDPVRERVERELAIRPVLMRSVLGAAAQLHGAVFDALWQLDPELALREELR